MALGSKLVVEAAGPSRTYPPVKALNGIFEMPSVLMAGIVRLLCLPLTKRILVGAVVLDIPLQWSKHLDMQQGAAAALGAMDGFDFSVTTLALIGLYIGWIFTKRAERRPLRVVWNWPIAAYTAAIVLSLFVSTNLQLSLFQVSLMLEMFLLYLYFAANLTSRNEILAVLRLILIGGMIEGAYLLVVAAAGHEFAVVRAMGLKSVIFSPDVPGGVLRFGGTVGSPNDAAAYLAIVITLAFAARYLMSSRSLRRLTIPTLILALAALVWTFSRGGWIEVTLSAGVLIAATWMRTGITLRRIVFLGTAICVIAAALYIPNPLSNRFTGNDNGSAYSRIPLMHLAENIIAANPVFGVGANNFAAVMGSYEGPEFRYAWIYTVHNQFLLVCSETGIIGLLAYLWIYGNLIRRGWRLWKTKDSLFAPVGLTIVAAVVGFMSHMMVDQFSGRALVQMVWIFAAIVAACELIQRAEAAGSLRFELQHINLEAKQVPVE